MDTGNLPRGVGHRKTKQLSKSTVERNFISEGLVRTSTGEVCGSALIRVQLETHKLKDTKYEFSFWSAPPKLDLAQHVARLQARMQNFAEHVGRLIVFHNLVLFFKN